jgi:glycosyltransferase involved in cell wall biosynthesis
MAQEAHDAGFPPEQLYWMPNPVDVEQFSPGDPEERRHFRQEQGIPADCPLVLYVGRLAPEKELPSLLGAFALALRQIPSARMVLVGDGPDRASLEGKAGQLGISGSVHFTGRCSASAVPSWLQASDVFALVSSNEGFSCSLLEAMSTGIASVVSDIPANTQLIEDGVQGLIAKLRDEDDLSRALVQLLADDSLRRKLGGAARQHVISHYSTDKVIDLYESLFAEAIAL